MNFSDPAGIAQACSEAINGGTGFVTLVVPGPAPRGPRVRLDRSHRRACPMGELLNWQDDPPRCVVRFDALDVLAYLAARGMVQIAKAPDDQTPGPGA